MASETAKQGASILGLGAAACAACCAGPILGIFAATFGAALETGLSAGYTLAQYLGWPWGKHLRAKDAARFHLVAMVTVVVATLIGLSGVDPVKVTEYSIVLSAAALPLT